MFRTSKAVASFSVDDLPAARQFYERTLGLKVSAVSDDGPLWLHTVGDRDILVYRKLDHAPATYTVLNFQVDDLERAVDELADRGVRIERYEGYQTDDRGIHQSRGHSIAWFTDPAGNGLSVFQEH